MKDQETAEKTRHCPICGNGSFWPVSFIDPESGRVARRSHGYYWRLCQRCGNAAPSVKIDRTELQAYWEKNRVEESSFQVTADVWSQRLAESRVWGQRTYEFVHPWVQFSGRRFLDIGCGLGGTVVCFAAHGWQASGLDPDPNTKPFHERQGIETTIGRIEEVALQGPYDVIGVAHAIYFIEDPKEFTRRMRELLSPEGLFVVVCSHLFSSLNLGRPGLAHTWYPTRDSLLYLLEQGGFELVARQTMKGSDMLLLRRSEPRQPMGRPWSALLCHRTQLLRYHTIGRLLRAGGFFYRRVRGKRIPIAA